ncbi:S-methyl-5'-thioinosine phosphorylase [Candidatus Thiothrix sp. Deng01]|uniref:Probable S-methyl-5'-thioinosine phosphorylase n=1 Tax=Candidatus Thiothrix phosphatis TaxID=3112415 RepID=A0ABU6D0H2_9GAMM|nr:S-methyl-5'-thioinosine phosphorylase [Candidatus Thiothrix sp. Deng01]MEB4592575.1 S-methyl-5'-thioinosine phosphorylase [Candidatus Thiothrix sp. Deng01]
MSIEFAVIGGTGMTEIEGLEVIHREVVHTPYGEPSGPVTHGMIEGKRIVFLARHGYTHTIPPHRINYRANLWALKSLGVEKIVAIAAVGGITPEMAPTRLAVPDQIIDYTYGRAHTFFEDGLTHVTHVDFSWPYCQDMRIALLTAAECANLDVVPRGVYAATQGPRLESAAEIARLERDGCDVVGMTAMPEASLARELCLCYASCAVVANWAAGKESKEISMDEIRQNLVAGMANARALLRALIC